MAFIEMDIREVWRYEIECLLAQDEAAFSAEEGVYREETRLGMKINPRWHYQSALIDLHVYFFPLPIMPDTDSMIPAALPQELADFTLVLWENKENGVQIRLAMQKTDRRGSAWFEQVPLEAICELELDAEQAIDFTGLNRPLEQTTGLSWIGQLPHVLVGASFAGAEEEEPLPSSFEYALEEGSKLYCYFQREETGELMLWCTTAASAFAGKTIRVTADQIAMQAQTRFPLELRLAANGIVAGSVALNNILDISQDHRLTFDILM